MSTLEPEAIRSALHPRSVAVIGATSEPERVGYCVLESLLLGGFAGPIYPIHPRHHTILGQKVYPRLSDVPGPIDLAVIALNQHSTMEAVDECGERGVKGVVCLAGGFKEMGQAGLELERQLADAATRHGIVLFGPNTLGVLNRQINLNATFWPLRIDRTLPAGLSLVSQSGGVGQMVVTQLLDQGLMVEKWIGVGNRAALDMVDCLRYLATDEATQAIGVFIEGTEQAREFVQLAAQVAERKPVVVLKAGSSNLAQKCAMTHTGSMAGDRRIYQDIFAQFGLFATDNIGQLVSACKSLSLAPVPAGNRVGILTPTAGPSILLVDELERLGCRIEPFSSDTMAELAPIFEGVAVVAKNPLDAALVGYAAEGYSRLAEIVLRDSNVDVLIAVGTEHKNRRFPVAELAAAQEASGKPVIVHFISTRAGRDVYMSDLHRAGIPVYCDASEVAWATAALAHYGQRELGERVA